MKLRKYKAVKKRNDKYFIVAEVSKLRQKNCSRKITAEKSQQQNRGILIVTAKS
jgi:hypothetical protein